jgi:C_GCAxxG_C_C family probable redox protein
MAAGMSAGDPRAMSRADRAAALFSEEYNCAQSVFWSFADALGLDPDTALRIASGFGGGVARRQEICGAVAGGVMVLGLRCGRGESEAPEANDAARARIEDFLSRFEARHGSILCRDLLEGCDIGTEAGREAFEARGLHERTCTPCVRSAVEIVAELLDGMPAQ